MSYLSCSLYVLQWIFQVEASGVAAIFTLEAAQNASQYEGDFPDEIQRQLDVISFLGTAALEDPVKIAEVCVQELFWIGSTKETVFHPHRSFPIQGITKQHPIPKASFNSTPGFTSTQVTNNKPTVVTPYIVLH